MPEGHFLLTHHHDRPGVVETLGVFSDAKYQHSPDEHWQRWSLWLAIALISVSAPLSELAMKEIRELPQIIDAVKFTL